MDLNTYQKIALTTALKSSSSRNTDIYHWILGLGGEVGEILEKFKKITRDHDADFSALDLDDLTKELGDVLWYLAVLADEFGITLEEVAIKNSKKLKSRQERGKLRGSGDNR
ncbi:nucleoside triphosphate pyrophosphohydrolase family protein [Candidatus Saccharibacteria bacterium]|nr:nucleoside triphosphate pyrophosphohydrolase family protein [Candidatus Saccharibacteria bacterium]